MNKVPHIQTSALETALRNCADLLTRLRDGEADDLKVTDVTAAIKDAIGQADALATIQRQSQIMMVGNVPFEVGIAEFPMMGDVKFPSVAIIEEGAKEGKGGAWGIGFYNRDAAAKLASAIMGLALLAPFPETAPTDGKAH